MVQMISESKRKIAALALAGAMAIGGAAGVATTIASPAQNQSGIVMEAEAATNSNIQTLWAANKISNVNFTYYNSNGNKVSGSTTFNYLYDAMVIGSVHNFTPGVGLDINKFTLVKWEAKSYNQKVISLNGGTTATGKFTKVKDEGVPDAAKAFHWETSSLKAEALKDGTATITIKITGKANGKEFTISYKETIISGVLMIEANSSTLSIKKDKPTAISKLIKMKVAQGPSGNQTIKLANQYKTRISLNVSPGNIDGETGGSVSKKYVSVSNNKTTNVKITGKKTNGSQKACITIAPVGVKCTACKPQIKVTD